MSIQIIKGDKSYLGKELIVIADRPIGATHPKHQDLVYPINYGFVPELIAGDGEEQDVYILGINQPVKEAVVTIIAVIERLDDNEDKWVGVPKELLGTPICYECNINKAIDFQEKFYTHTCDAIYEKTCGAVMYTEIDGERRYLLIQNESGHIGFPKGHVEYAENETQTAIREVFEETKLNAAPIDGFRIECSYVNKSEHHKNAVYYLSHYDFKEALIQQEEISESWLLPYTEAMEKLNYPQDKIVLKKAEDFIFMQTTK